MQKQQRKKLLMVIPNLGLGGAQRAFHDHSVELQKRYDVTEAVFNLDEPNIYPSGNPLENMEVAGGGNTLDKASNFWKRVRRLRALKQKTQADVCISHLEGADYVNLLSKDKEKIILLIQGSKVHDRNISGPLGWLRKQVMMPALYRRADRIVTVSRDIMPEIIDAFGVEAGKVLTIHNSFEVERVWGQAQEPLPADMQAVYDVAPTLVTSARLAVQKNQAPLLQIFADLLKRRPAKLVFVGDGELRDELTGKARTLGLRVYEVWKQEPLTPDYDVYFMGLQQNPFKFIRPADLFVFPSGWEGFPLALGEAMICGAAVVTTDCPTGPREMLSPTTATPTNPIRTAEWAEYGVLMPMLTEADTLQADEKVWTDTIEQLLTDPAERQRLGQLARRRMEDFTHKKIFQRWVELIEQVLVE
ncbi:glycosyltransferase [Hymenobacter sp. RP-2-7]|uniref:Glycosyltransferase n=1 Tax=Hymenobacter polaris TaxID=2682546 RepID=A0A7Y0FQ56_9BACT|nr:glycosyltransferase [Hymenobacter polaris]NML68069.1 glycosyltransferase [Hymenobacter polaris]